jgi:hypothetical protein
MFVPFEFIATKSQDSLSSYNISFFVNDRWQWMLRMFAYTNLA